MKFLNFYRAFSDITHCGESEGYLVTAGRGWNSKLPSGLLWHCGRTLFLAGGEESRSSLFGFLQIHPSRGVEAPHYCLMRV